MIYYLHICDYVSTFLHIIRMQLVAIKKQVNPALNGNQKSGETSRKW